MSQLGNITFVALTIRLKRAGQQASLPITSRLRTGAVSQPVSDVIVYLELALGD
jgi:hypothetical protein